MHAGSVADYEEDIIAAGGQLIWVLEQTALGQPGTATACRDTADFVGSDDGWCVGDGQTQPTPGVWDNSPLANNRGFDVIVERSTMEIVYVTTHGTGSDDENTDGADLLAEVEAAVAAAR